jgi:3-mercaptopyruvate sulfurtransferase SseA
LALFAIALLVSCQAAPSPTARAALPTATPVPTPVAASAEQGARPIPADAADVPRITPDQLRALLESPQQVILLDTRSVDEYAAGHIPGAANMPLAQVETLYSQLPRGVKLVAY